MREENLGQGDLPGLSTDELSAEKAAELSKVAALSAKVIGDGLVREHRPIFVYDSKLANKKSANAARQEKFREALAEKGLVTAQIPKELADLVKAENGDWKYILNRVNPAPAAVGDKLCEIKPTKPAAGRMKILIKEVVEELIKEIPSKTITVEKPVFKLTSEQKNVYEIGLKVQKLKGWRALFLRFIL